MPQGASPNPAWASTSASLGARGRRSLCAIASATRLAPGALRWS